MNREQTVERLRAWARRAQSEAQYADTREDRLKWAGQAQALAGVASLLSEQGADMSDFDIWTQVVSDREKCLASWKQQQSGSEINTFAGQMAGYDVALTALKDVDGVVWPRREAHTN